MLRLLFEKTGNAIWISHLDLMRLFQRAFKRAGLHLSHTQGFNPRPSVSIALPLSVGVESRCELLDFDLEGDSISCDAIKERLNRCLTEGVKVVSVYEGGGKLRDLKYLECEIVLEYDSGIPETALEQIENLFKQKELTVSKKTKSGLQEQDIIPMIRWLSVHGINEYTAVLKANICCQNPTLNPAQLVAAITKYLPGCQPDFTKCTRIGLYDSQGIQFR